MGDFFSAIFQGIIQGVTEFLPVSSSGHLAIYQHLTGKSGEAGLFFSVLLHIGTLAAVCVVYRNTLARLIKEFFSMVSDIFHKEFKWKEMNAERRTIMMLILSTLMLVPFVLPIFGGNSLKDLMDPVTRGDHLWVVGLMLIVTSLLLAASYYLTSKKRDLHRVPTNRDAVIIGIVQGFAAMFPGLSRSGSTTATALMCGIDKKNATQYSFILSVPAVIGALLLELKDVATTPGVLDGFQVVPAIFGMITAAIVGIFAIKLFIWMIKKNSYIIFSVYCGIVGIITLIISFV